MKQPAFMRFDDNLESAQAVQRRVDHIRKHGTLSETDQDRVAIIEGLGAIATVLSVVGMEASSGVVATSIESANAGSARAHAAFDIVDAIVTVADAEAQTMLAALPKFKVPERKSSGGGAMSIGSRRDPGEEAVDEASPRVVASLDLVEFALADDTYFGGTAAAKFFAYLFAHKPAKADGVKDVIEDAFKASEEK